MNFNHFQDFIANSPSPYHVSKNIQNKLRDLGFKDIRHFNEVNSTEAFVFVNNGSVIAYRPGKVPYAQGTRLIGTHTDSPGLKLRPNPIKKIQNYNLLKVEIYGGPILDTWLDRDLGIAGICHGSNSEGQFKSFLVNSRNPVGMIPSLAIHLAKEADKIIDRQKDLNPIFSLGYRPDQNWNEIMIESSMIENYDDKFEVRGFDLIFYDTHQPTLIGIDQELVVSPRLDNLASVYAALNSFSAVTNPEYSCVFVSCNHEEIGSQSRTGAAGTFLKDVLVKLSGNADQFAEIMNRSFFMSVDNAHGIHPSFVAKHDDNHLPLLNGGPVLKYNSSGRYITDSFSGAVARHIAEKAEVPLQEFSSINTLPCGSTIGPMIAARTGVAGIDVGIPTLGMHSIRESASTQDFDYLEAFLKQFISSNINMESL